MNVDVRRQEGSMGEEPEFITRPTRKQIDDETRRLWSNNMHAGREKGVVTEHNKSDCCELEDASLYNVGLVIQLLRSTAEEPDSDKNPDSVAHHYPNHTKEDLISLAESVEDIRARHEEPIDV